ncbi:MAG: DUF6265 family protein [Blastocatellales bacterium]
MQCETLRTLWLGTTLALFGLASVLSPTIKAIQPDKPPQFFQSDNQSGKPAQSSRIEGKIDDLAWLSGDWETAPGRMQIDEHWTKVAGNSMIGMSRAVAGGRTVFFEYLRIEARGADIFYVAHPKARTPGTDFKLVKLTSQEAVFENPAHDFPKRIIYRKNGDGSLTARIEGDGTEKERPQDFHYRPIPRAN